MQDQVSLLKMRRNALAERLQRIPQVSAVINSNTNYILFKLNGARTCYTTLAEQGLFVRAYKNPSLDDWLRISIGSDSQIQQVEDALGSWGTQEKSQ